MYTNKQLHILGNFGFDGFEKKQNSLENLLNLMEQKDWAMRAHVLRERLILKLMRSSSV